MLNPIRISMPVKQRRDPKSKLRQDKEGARVPGGQRSKIGQTASTDKPFSTRATLGTSASTLRTTREQESQEDREARLDRQRLRTSHLTPGQCLVPLLLKLKSPYKRPGSSQLSIRRSSIFCCCATATLGTWWDYKQFDH